MHLWRGKQHITTKGVHIPVKPWRKYCMLPIFSGNGLPFLAPFLSNQS